ncbi:30S ribosomal protein S6e [Candidatus Bathyarchaeota archaeon]|nr:30S ribosomal protein S6e [Candidatus Bathyarchaeota archaeon]RJS86638.1 MAG: 30S ribosomal protein S6e [Candidatus Bathyarchaeota archaeon]
MAKFKVVISDPETGKSNVVELEDARAVPLIGRKIGDVLDGTVVGLSGYKVLITGGTDSSGFPMRPDIHGGIKARVLIGRGIGYRAKGKGDRRRRTVRGNTITEDTAQINMKIIEKPSRKGRKSEEKTESKSET